MEIQNCRSCKAEINWIVYKGKSHPIDAKPVKVFTAVEDEFGNHRYWEYVNGYTSHFVTCPDAEKWRKKKDAKNTHT